MAPSFAEGVREIADAQPGMILEGVVTNVTKFGAFVDIGVHQDGLGSHQRAFQSLHQGPNEAVKVGQIVKVKVLSADVKTKRIALSIKALSAAPPRPVARPAPKPQATLDEKLATLSMKWKVRG